MAIELLQPKQEKLRAIEITVRGVLVQGQHLKKGDQRRIPEPEAFDLVHAGQAKFLDLTKEPDKAKK